MRCRKLRALKPEGGGLEAKERATAQQYLRRWERVLEALPYHIVSHLWSVSPNMSEGTLTLLIILSSTLNALVYGGVLLHPRYRTAVPLKLGVLASDRQVN